MKIILSGGGTLGPVTPLIAIVDACRQENLAAEFVWVGTKNGVEQQIVAENHIPYRAISSGKWRRYFSFWNFIDLFKILSGFFQSLRLLKKEKPDLLISAGAYVSVPLHVAAYFLKIPCWVHQQDVRLGLANKIMSRLAAKTTVSTEYCLDCFEYKGVEVIGNPVRRLNHKDEIAAKLYFNIKDTAPVILILGGGTGSRNLNTATCELVKRLPREWHFIHLTGIHQVPKMEAEAKEYNPNYQTFTILTDAMGDAYKAADLVVARGGFGTLTEMSYFKKAAVIIPMTRTHQELNAKIVADNKAGVVLAEKKNLIENLEKEIKELINNPRQREDFGERLSQVLPVVSPKKIVEIIKDLMGKNQK